MTNQIVTSTVGVNCRIKGIKKGPFEWADRYFIHVHWEAAEARVDVGLVAAAAAENISGGRC